MDSEWRSIANMFFNQKLLVMVLWEGQQNYFKAREER